MTVELHNLPSERLASEGWPERTIPDLLFDAARSCGDAKALEDGERSLTFADFAAAVDSAAAGLVGRGVKPGDVVAYHLPADIDTVILHYAILRVGAVSSPLSAVQSEEDLRTALEIMRPKLVIYGRERHTTHHNPMALASAALPADEVLPLNGSVELSLNGPGVLPDVPLDPNAPAYIVWTPESARAGKGIVHTHNTGLCGLSLYLERLGIGAEDGFLMIPPLGLHMGILAMHALAFAGVRLVVIRQWDPDAVCMLIEQTRPTYTSGGRSRFIELLRCARFPMTDVSSVKLFVLHGVQLPVPIAEMANLMWPACRLLTSYGAPEEGFMAVLGLDEPSYLADETDGRPLKLVEMKIVDSDGIELPHDNEGDIVVRTPQEFAGYVNNAELTRAAILPGGWRLTGDRGVRHADGTLRVLSEQSGVRAGAEIPFSYKMVLEIVRERESQYQGIFEATADGLAVWDAETGRIVDVNPAYCGLHGYARDELINATPDKIIHPDDLPFARTLMQTVRSGREYRGTFRELRKDGSAFLADVLGKMFSFNGKPHVLGVIRDISEQARAYELLEQRVAERTHELSTLLDVSRQVSSSLELQTLLGVVLDQLKTVVDYSHAAILGIDGPELLVLQCRLTGEEELSVGLQVPHDGALARTAWEAIKVGEPAAFSAFAGSATSEKGKMTAALRSRSELVVPLMVQGQAAGCLWLTHWMSGFFDERRTRLIVAFAQQAVAALANARLFTETQAKAALEERQRLARDLHDSVSQSIYGIAMYARAAQLLSAEPKLTEPLEHILSLAEAALTEMRSMIFELRPESLEREGLIPALRRQEVLLRVRRGVTVDTFLMEEPAISLDKKEVLYRVAQEAVQNIIKHSQATHASLRLGEDGGKVVLEVRDDGVGFNQDAIPGGHLGIQSMRERVSRLGGELRIQSSPGEGTWLQVQLTTEVIS